MPHIKTVHYAAYKSQTVSSVSTFTYAQHVDQHLL